MVSWQGLVRLVRLDAQNYHVRFIETLERYVRSAKVARSRTAEVRAAARVGVAAGPTAALGPTQVRTYPPFYPAWSEESIYFCYHMNDCWMNALTL